MEMETNTTTAPIGSSPPPPLQSYGGQESGGPSDNNYDDDDGANEQPPPPPTRLGTVDDDDDAAKGNNDNDLDDHDDDEDDTPTQSHFRCLTCRVTLLPPPTTNGDGAGGAGAGDGDGRSSIAAVPAPAAAEVVVPHPLLLTPSCRDCALAAAAVEGAVRSEEVRAERERRGPGGSDGGSDAVVGPFAAASTPSWTQDACSWCARREEGGEGAGADDPADADDDGDGGQQREAWGYDGEISSPLPTDPLDALDDMQTGGGADDADTGGDGGDGGRAIGGGGEGNDDDGEGEGGGDGDDDDEGDDDDGDDEILPSTLFLCDRCPRAFCFECLCRAHLVAPPSSSSSSSDGDGDGGENTDDQEEDEERSAFRRELGLSLRAVPEFECPACSPPEGLRRLRLGPRLRLLRTGIAPFPPGGDDDDDDGDGDGGDDGGKVGRGGGGRGTDGGGGAMSDDDEEEDYPPLLRGKNKIPPNPGAGVPPREDDDDDDDDGDGDAEEVARRVATLSNLEDRLGACQSRLEASSLEKREAELRRRRGVPAPRSDCSGGGTNDHGGEAERRIRGEMEAYASTWEGRCEAVADAIPAAQDALEDAGVSLEAFYYGYRRRRRRGGEGGGGGEDGPDELDGAGKEEGGEEEAWRRAADEALNRRDVEEGFRAGEFKGSHGYKPKNPLVYRLDPPCDWSSDDEDDGDDDSEAGGGGGGGGSGSRAIIDRSDESVRRNFEIVDDIQSLDAAIDVRLSSPGRTGKGERNCWAGAVAAQFFDDDDALGDGGGADGDEGHHVRRLFRKALRAEDRRWEGVASRNPSQRTVDAPRIRRKHVGGESSNDGEGETIPGRRGVGTEGGEGERNGSKKDRKRIAPTLLVGKGQRSGPAYKKLRLFGQGGGGGHGGGTEDDNDGPDVGPSDMNGDEPPAEEAPLPNLPRPADLDSLASGFPHSDFVLNEAEARRQSSAAKVDGAAGDGGAPPPAPVQKVSVAKPLADALKPHQREGVQFMWNLICGSVGMVRNHPPWTTQRGRNDEVRGCILAHNMGLGKSLQSVAVIHTLLCHPELHVPTYVPIGDNKPKEADAQTGLPQPVQDEAKDRTGTAKTEDADDAEKGEGDPPMQIRRRRIFKRILLCVPVNTLANWENEFVTWVGGFDEGKKGGVDDDGEGHSIGEDLPFSPVVDAGPIRIYCPNKVTRGPGRNQIVQTWYQYGGVLLASFEMLRNLVKNAYDVYNKPVGDHQTGEIGSNDSNKRMAISLLKALQSPGPDLVVVDEAHQALKKSTTEISKVLYGLQTTRRIALTGTPFQNNLLEYFCMSNWVMPGCLGEEAKFERQFVFPIMNGIRADSTPDEVDLQQRKTRKLYRRLLPFVHRKDSKILTDDLPKMQQAVIVVRQTKLQGTLYRAFKRYQREKDSKNFLEAYGKMRPIFNHPGCLLLRASKPSQPSGYAGDYDNVNGRNGESMWWQQTYEKHPDMASIKHGGKMMLLIQILVHADLIGEKVVVFSQCLKTLDYIESILNMPNWEQHVPLLSELSPGKSWGPWRKNSEYLRIDGGTTASTRGELVSSFNALKSKTMLPKLFLISTKAGGIGINLVAANRVVIFDSHWNPAVDLQALYRCYRYGQTRPVFAYRFLAEGTMEEKIYSRQVNKSSLAERVVDRNNPLRAFTEAELENLMDNNTWVQCDSCSKWRMLPPDADADEVPDKWFCYMNVLDRDRSDCLAEEKGQRFYLEFFTQRYAPQQMEVPRDDFRVARDATTDGGEGVADGKEESDARDIILDSILSKAKAWVSKHHFHDTLLEDHGGDDQDTMAIVDEGAVIDITEEDPDKSQGSNPIENHGMQGDSRLIPPEQHMIPLINLGHAGMVTNQSHVSQAMSQLAPPHADQYVGEVSTTDERKHAVTQGGRSSANANPEDVIDLLSSDDEA